MFINPANTKNYKGVLLCLFMDPFTQSNITDGTNPQDDIQLDIINCVRIAN